MTANGCILASKTATKINSMAWKNEIHRISDANYTSTAFYKT